jgi:hypothetical protein
MTENLNSPENIDPQEVVNILEARGIEDPEAKELLERYAEHCEKEADKADPMDEIATNLARIECVIKVAKVYLKTERYRDYGRESLEEIFNNPGAGHSEATQGLEDEVARLLREYQ